MQPGDTVIVSRRLRGRRIVSSWPVTDCFGRKSTVRHIIESVWVQPLQGAVERITPSMVWVWLADGRIYAARPDQVEAAKIDLPKFRSEALVTPHKSHKGRAARKRLKAHRARIRRSQRTSGTRKAS